MNCSVCGTELEGGALCTTCQATGSEATHAVNIEFKDFRISELLEITHTKCETGSRKNEPLSARRR